MNELVKKEVIEKLRRHLDNSYVIINIGDLRDLIPELYELIGHKELSQGPLAPKLITQDKKEIKIVGDNEIITLLELEQRLIHEALKRTKGDVKKAALEVGISERDFYRKLKEYKINHNVYSNKQQSKNSK